jgi:hypothetical protein
MITSVNHFCYVNFIFDKQSLKPFVPFGANELILHILYGRFVLQMARRYTKQSIIRQPISTKWRRFNSSQNGRHRTDVPRLLLLLLLLLLLPLLLLLNYVFKLPNTEINNTRVILSIYLCTVLKPVSVALTFSSNNRIINEQ